jgi:hypothetical protein
VDYFGTVHDRSVDIRFIPHEGEADGLAVGRQVGYMTGGFSLSPFPAAAGPFDIEYDPSYDPWANEEIENAVSSGTITGTSSPPGVFAAFISGLGTGAKAVANAGTDTLFGFATLGSDWNPLEIGVTQEDIDNGYGLSYGIARGSSELLAGVATGGLAAAASRGGKALQLGGAAVAGADLLGNLNTARGGINDAARSGLNWSNGAQIAFGGLGLAGNLASISRATDAAARTADSVAGGAKGGNFVQPKLAFIEGVPDHPRSPAHARLQPILAESAAESGEYSRVAQGSIHLSEFSGLKHTPDIKPDVMGLTPDGRIDMWEILSPGQNKLRLEDKLQKAMEQLPLHMRGGYRVLDPETFR